MMNKYLIRNFGWIFSLVLIISVIISVKTLQSDIKECTPSQEHTEIIEKLNSIESRLPLSVIEEPTINDGQVYCNSVGCWSDEKAYKERDKIDNRDKNKFMYIDEQGKNNYFDNSKFK